MRNFSTLLLFLIFIIGCKKDSDNEIILTETLFVEPGSCFLEYRIEESELVIKDSATYAELEKKLRNNWDLSDTCNSAHLPEVDFSNSFIVGKYTEGYGCDASYEREVVYNNNQQAYNYKIKPTYTGNCSQPVLTSYNWAIIPKHVSHYNIFIEVSY